MKFEIVDGKLTIEDEHLKDKYSEIAKSLDAVKKLNDTSNNVEFFEMAKSLDILLDVVKKLNDTSNNVEFSDLDNKKIILSLDVNNSEHLKQYASAMALSEKGAKEMLISHQNDIKESLIKRLSLPSLIQIIKTINENDTIINSKDK